MFRVKVMPRNHLFDQLVVVHALIVRNSIGLPSNVGHKGNLVVQVVRNLTLVDV